MPFDFPLWGGEGGAEGEVEGGGRVKNSFWGSSYFEDTTQHNSFCILGRWTHIDMSKRPTKQSKKIQWMNDEWVNEWKKKDFNLI